MLFSLGPVMRYELITTSRRRRYYFLRVIYGLLLLFQLWSLFRAWEVQQQPGGRPFPPGWQAPRSMDEMQAFAEDAFIQFAGVQGLVLMLLIPALVSGIISDEYQRKTLHYLLASRLSSAEIVLGKLAARLVHVVAFVALGLPIVSLLMLYGGLNPVNIFYVYMGTATLVLFVSGFSIAISILARRPRDAILAAYGLGALWLLLPIWLEGVSKFLGGALDWVPAANDAVLLSNPIKVWLISTQRQLRLEGPSLHPGLVGVVERVRVALRNDVGHPGVTRPALFDSGRCRVAAAARQRMARREAADRLVHAASSTISAVRRITGGGVTHPQ